MDTMILLLMMLVIGALIGGVTNSLAIKMLFRPYHAIFIGHWRLPFTPGLIPKRRGELAEQMGKLVVTHLLTADAIKKKLESTFFMNEMTTWLQTELRKMLKSEKSVYHFIEEWFSIENSKEQVDRSVTVMIDQQLEKAVDRIRPIPLKEVIPTTLQSNIDMSIPELSEKLLIKVQEYVASADGKERLNNMIDRFLVGRGALGSMISMFLGNDRLVDKIQPELIKLLKDRGTAEIVEEFIRREWMKLQEMKVEEIEKRFATDEILTSIGQKIKEHLPLELLEKPLYEWAHRYEPLLVEQLLPNFVNKAGQVVASEAVHFMKKMNVDDIVKEQVEQFSVERLEDMVLSISKREFKLITYLGVLLGGLIGLIQGVIIIFIS